MRGEGPRRRRCRDLVVGSGRYGPVVGRADVEMKYFGSRLPDPAQGAGVPHVLVFGQAQVEEDVVLVIAFCFPGEENGLRVGPIFADLFQSVPGDRAECRQEFGFRVFRPGEFLERSAG